MNYEKKYKEALEWARKVMQGKVGFVLDEVLEKFPELKESESEDERIRKNLISYITISKHRMFSERERNEMIAWLEKQGQTFTKKDIDDAYLKGVCDAKQELEKQGEQKSAKWSEEDKKMIDAIYSCVDSHYDGLAKNVLLIWLKSLKDRVQPKQEWSEEDQDNFKHLMDEIVCLGNNRDSLKRLYYDRLIKFLEELKKRAQPREEWCCH